MRFCELRQKEVVNIRNCQRLGFVADIEFDVCKGEICQLIIPVSGKFCGIFGHDTEYVIGWRCVRQIGDDLILVDVDQQAICRNSGDDCCLG